MAAASGISYLENTHRWQVVLADVAWMLQVLLLSWQTMSSPRYALLSVLLTEHSIRLDSVGNDA